MKSLLKYMRPALIHRTGICATVTGRSRLNGGLPRHFRSFWEQIYQA